MNKRRFIILDGIIAKTSTNSFLRSVSHKKTASQTALINLITVFSVIFFSSCNVTKLIPEDKYLVTKNRVYIHYNDSIAKSAKVKGHSLTKYIPLSQTPNSRFFGMDISTWLYMKSKPENNNWWNKTLRRVGQEPRYYNAVERERSEKNMNIYMASIGYLDNTITSHAEYKKKRAYLKYDVVSSKPYYIDSVWYNFNDESLAKYVLSDSSSMLIKKDALFMREVLNQERQRIAKILNNKGFYTFTANNINYLIDTSHATNGVNIQLNVNKRLVQNKLESHKIYKINNVHVYPDFNGLIDSTTVIDTVSYNNIDFIYQNGKINVKTKPLYRQVRFAPSDTWLPESVENTTRSFMNMQYYKTMSIDFTNVNQSDTTGYGYLDSHIRLIPSKIHNIKVEGEISSSPNYTSLIARLGYSNKNIFKHSEVFDISFNAGYDIMYSKAKNDAYQFGVDASLSFPKLVVPFIVKHTKFIHNIESQVSIGYDIQNRPDYRRHILTTEFGYKWSNGKHLRFRYNPISINYIGLPRVSQDYLDGITNEYLKNTYTNQLIVGTNFNVIYNKENIFGSNYILKLNVETAGNTLYLGGLVFGQKKHTNSTGNNYFTILGEQYAQYARMDVDFSYKYNFLGKSSIVSRFYAGIGTGYGNSQTMPFERFFYAGGNTSMRGWQIRGLGPGGKIFTDNNISYANSLGDIRLELNLEGRFPILGPITGAVFFDLGNVWSNGHGETDPSAIFHFDEFYKQLGFNTGVGIRLDFDFLVLRLDWGIILHDPNKIAGNRWMQRFSLNDTTLHFAIGYPF